MNKCNLMYALNGQSREEQKYIDVHDQIIPVNTIIAAFREHQNHIEIRIPMHGVIRYT